MATQIFATGVPTYTVCKQNGHAFSPDLIVPRLTRWKGIDVTKGRPGGKLSKTFIATLRGYDVYTVNAFGVRDLAKRDEEFTTFASHADFPDLIPGREIWVDERLFGDEGLFYLANALTRLREHEKGSTTERADAAGLNVERALRERLVGVKFRAGRPHKRVPERIYDREYATLPDVQRAVVVWLVEGNLVRSFYKTDYTEGGHGYVYRWVPKGEIWVERGLDPAEIPYVIAHEYLELRLMRDEGLDYDHAHEISATVEYEIREGGGARSLVAPGGRKFAERDLPGLTSPAFFDYVVQHHLRKKKAT
ncbi:MAG: hypothetical protein LC745_02325 [Planctomycetia bacterium]|nr:hypothetical protein [Planctomycetia bacterium]